MFVDMICFQLKSIRNISIALFVFSIAMPSFAQETKEQKAQLKAAQNYLSEAQHALQQEEFPQAEADYRNAISLNPKSEIAKYNLGTAYYGKAKNAEAMLRFKQAAQTATDKSEKHKAFHNLGNTFMNEKKYTEAVEAYKNALRNNPNDDETRYNLALAKDLLDKNPPPPQDDNKDDKNKDQDNKDQDNKDQDNKDQQDQDDQNKEGDKGDEKENKDEGDQKEDKQEGDKDKDQGEPNKPKEQEGDKPQEQQPVPGQLSPQQVKSLLEAMNNEEKKVQDKINAEKQKGAKVKSDKDW